MKLPPDMQRLDHIFDYCEEIEETIERFGRSYETFASDKDYQRSILMCLMQIGELVRDMSDDFKRATAESVPWVKVRALRNVIVHKYGRIVLEDIWQSAFEDIPELKAFCDEQLRPYGDPDDGGSDR